MGVSRSRFLCSLVARPRVRVPCHTFRTRSAASACRGPAPRRMVAPVSAEPTPRRDRQVVRMLGILKALTDGGRVTVTGLAARFRTTRQSIYRDLHGLHEVGIPIVGDAGGGYGGVLRLAPGFRPGLPWRPADAPGAPGAGVGGQGARDPAALQGPAGDGAPEAPGDPRPARGGRAHGARRDGERRRAGDEGPERPSGDAAPARPGHRRPSPLPGGVPGARARPTPPVPVRPVPDPRGPGRRLRGRPGAGLPEGHRAARARADPESEGHGGDVHGRPRASTRSATRRRPSAWPGGSR